MNPEDPRHHQYPIALDDELLQFKRATFNVKVYGCINNAPTLKSLWESFVSLGYPLNEIDALLSEPRQIVRAIDSLAVYTPIIGVISRQRKLMERLQTLVSNDAMENAMKVNKILEALITATDELRIAHALHKLGFAVEFGAKKGADLINNHRNIGIIKAEAKSRLNIIHELESSSKSAVVYETAILSLLCRDAYPKLEKAFDEQESNIALINLTRSQYGHLMAAFMKLYNIDYHLRSAFDKALKLVESGEQAVLAYYEIAGEINEYAAVTYRRNAVQTIGGILDYVESIFKRRGAALDYYDLATFAQDPNGFLHEVKRSLAKR